MLEDPGSASFSCWSGQAFLGGGGAQREPESEPGELEAGALSPNLDCRWVPGLSDISAVIQQITTPSGPVPAASLHRERRCQQAEPTIRGAGAGMGEQGSTVGVASRQAEGCLG